MYNERITDKEYVGKYLAGDAALVREMTLLSFILTQEVSAG